MKTLELVLVIYALAFIIGISVALIIKWIAWLSARLDLQFDPVLRHQYYRMRRIKKYHKENVKRISKLSDNSNDLVAHYYGGNTKPDPNDILKWKE